MRIFQMKSKPNGTERFQQFIDENFICIGWTGLGSLENVSKDGLRDRLAVKYGTGGHQLGHALGQVNSFVNTMQKGDIVIITRNNNAYFAVVGDYTYASEYDNSVDAMCHRRPVQWLGTLPVKNLNASVRQVLANRNTICAYPGTYGESGLDKIFPELPQVENCFAQNNSPDGNFTHCDAPRTRLDDLFDEALGVLERELRSEDVDTRLKAAAELIRLKSRAN